VQQESPADVGQQYAAVTDRRYSTADERSRARKGADGRISGRKAGSARPTAARSGLRVLPCSALLRLCAKNADA